MLKPQILFICKQVDLLVAIQLVYMIWPFLTSMLLLRAAANEFALETLLLRSPISQLRKASGLPMMAATTMRAMRKRESMIALIR